MKKWIIPGGRIPLDFNSSDSISILNLGEKSTIHIYIHHEDKESVGPYKIEINEKRKCKINLAHLIEPEALLLDEPYSLLIETPHYMVVQFTRRDTTGPISISGGIAYSQE